MGMTLPVRILRRKGKRGLGSAYIDGFRKALVEFSAEMFISMDADFSHDPESIPLLIGGIKEGYDIVVGSRYIPGGSISEWGFLRRIISATCNWLSRKMLGLQIRDVTTGFRCYRRKVLEVLPWEKIRSEGFAFMEEILYFCKNLGFRIGELPITFRERSSGVTKLNAWEIVKVFYTLLRLGIAGGNDKRSKVSENNNPE